MPMKNLVGSIQAKLQHGGYGDKPRRLVVQGSRVDPDGDGVDEQRIGS